LNGLVAYSDPIRITTQGVLGVKLNGDKPLVFKLEQNFPNPFNPTTTIQYSIAKAGLVTLKIYNVIGQEVASLVNESKGPGRYSVQWSAGQYASGAYFYRLVNNGNVQVQKMMLIK
jgi:hypothetical protein